MITKTRIPMMMVAALLGVLAVSVSCAWAEAPSPWFHLTSVARPGNLQAGVAQNEVQDLTVSGAPGESYVLSSATPAEVKEMEKGTRQFEKLAGFQVGEEPAAIQAALEGLYGPGNVTVTAPSPALAEVGLEPYVVTFVGSLANRPVGAINTELDGFFGVPATVTVTPVQAGQPDGYLVASAVNVGETDVQGSMSPVTLLDRLPSGVSAVFAEANTRNNFGTIHAPVVCAVSSAQLVECTFNGKLPPYQQIELVVAVAVHGNAHSGEQNEVSVSGGGAPAARIAHPILVSDAPTPFGVEDYELTPEEVGGVPDAQAGSHPFQLTATFNLKQTPNPNASRGKPGEAQPAALAKDLNFRLPAGLLGNPTSVPRCTIAQFNTFTTKPGGGVEENECPEGSVVGIATIAFTLENSMETATLPLYNLEPAAGEPARFGFQPAGLPVILDTSVRTGEDYGVTVHVDNIIQTVGFLSNTVTFWGVPGDPRHDNLRGPNCQAETAEDPVVSKGVCRRLEEVHPPPLLSLPTSCSGSPLETSVLADSWAAPQALVGPEPNPSTLMPRMVGCGLLPFAAEVKVSPDLEAGSTPSGLKVDVHVPQQTALNSKGLTPAMLRNIVVTLPEGLQLNPSAADGLQACTLGQVGLDNANEAACPNASKIANVTIKSPLLPAGQFLHGFVYLAAPQNFAGTPPENPFSKHVAMYLIARDPVSGVLVKLPGSVELGGEPGVSGLQAGQIRSTFADNPQLPFEDAEIEFFGGERAPLATPALCRRPGEAGYVTHARFEPWSNTPTHGEAVASSSEFHIVTGPNGNPCSNPLPFAASLASGSTNNNAGSFSALTTTLSRPSGEQNIQSVTLHYPPGLSGLLSGVELCPEPQASAGACGPNSQIGETVVSVGVGGDPFTVTGGKVYITGPYAGAPFGLSIVNPAKAGPFVLQEGRPIVVRAKVEVDPHTAALTIVTDPSGAHAIPTLVEGFALQIQHVNVLVNRPGFTFNPTNCTPAHVTGVINSAEGASTPVSVPFQVTNCAVLKFAPKFQVSTAGRTSRAKGASLNVKLTYPKAPFGTQANIARVKVDLPKQLPSRLTTLQKACTAAQFDLNPATCPAASFIGHAKATTPLLPVPLEGPAIFVSHGGEAFPSLIVVLQGYGVTLDLVGSTFISKKGITSSTFKTVPDAPVGSFELSLPEGKYSALAANGSLCKTKLVMPTEFLAQNGAKINESTKISVTGCAKHARHARKKNHHHQKKKRKK